jgi:hypothetical protein
MAAFHTRISDLAIGGTFMTVRCRGCMPRPSILTITQLLITFSNISNTWPRYFVLKGRRHRRA